MGQRANLIVTQQGLTEVFYTHWRANTLPCDLFWGPTYSTAFARSQKKVDVSELLDEVWAEGGAVIDLDRKFLLLFGGEDLCYDLSTRRLFLRLLKNRWEGWDTQWAHEGVCDLVDYLHIPRSTVLVQQSPAPPVPFKLAKPRPHPTTLASLKLLRGQTMLFPTYDRMREHLSAGPALLEMNKTGGLAEFHMPDGLPTNGGFHIDEARQSIEIWTTWNAPNILERVTAWWPGWSVAWYQDRFELQIERTGGRFNVAVQSQEQSLQQIREMLLREETEGAVEGFLRVTEILAREDRDIKIHPDALRDARLTLPADLRKQMLDAAIAAL
jgi:hypothetical protein